LGNDPNLCRKLYKIFKEAEKDAIKMETPYLSINHLKIHKILKNHVQTHYI